MASTATKSDIERLEQKLDMIIKFFSIGKLPRRPNTEIKQLARDIAYERKVSWKK
jgi:hypothetical protein